MVDILGTVGTMTGIWQFFEDKFKDDHKQFKKEMEKVVRTVCENYREKCNNIPEFRNVIDDGMHHRISVDLLECIGANKVFDLGKVLTSDEVPEQVREAVKDELEKSLIESLQYLQRDYIARSTEQLQKIRESQIKDGKTLEYLKKTVEYDSAKEWHNPPITDKNEFHYIMRMSTFCGREETQQELQKFCFEDKHRFCWTVVTGSGGTGKSRLCYEFLLMMEEKGWSVCLPVSNARSDLDKCSESLINDTLFVLDNAEMITNDVIGWLASLNAQRFKKHLVRVILIQRQGSFEDIKRFCSDNENTVLRENLYGYIELKKIDEKSLSDIMRSYASKKYKKIFCLGNCKKCIIIWRVLIENSYAHSTQFP